MERGRDYSVIARSFEETEWKELRPRHRSAWPMSKNRVEKAMSELIRLYKPRKRKRVSQIRRNRRLPEICSQNKLQL